VANAKAVANAREVDDLIEPRQTRATIARALRMPAGKQPARQDSEHGNPPA
jgi:acetyl-CoA carboxylase carboxyltransferase component